MKPSYEFFETLGQYIYEYVNDDGVVLYIGKGIGDRCLAHVKDKGYDIDHCYIVARNLEKFLNKPSVLLESYLIKTRYPRDNQVAGHYPECFKMASLSSMFADFQSEQFDNFEKFPDWYVDNYQSAFKGKLRAFNISASNIWVQSSGRNSIYMQWYWYPVEQEVKVTFEVAYYDDQKLEAVKNKVVDWLGENGYSEPFPDGKKQKLAVNCENIDEVVSLFKKFMS